MTETVPDSAEREASASISPNPFDELAALPLQPDDRSLWTLDSHLAFFRAVMYFADRHEPFADLDVPEGLSKNFMRQFCRRRHSLGAWASALAVSARNNAKLYRNIRDLLRQKWNRMPMELAFEYSAVLRKNANRVLGLAEEREFRRQRRPATPELPTPTGEPPDARGPSTQNAGGNGKTLEPDGAEVSDEPASFDDIPPFDESSGKWKRAKAVARTARALKIGCTEEEVSDEQLKKAEGVLRTARSNEQAKRRRADGTVGEDRDGRVFRTILENGHKSAYYLDLTTTGKKA